MAVLPSGYNSSAVNGPSGFGYYDFNNNFLPAQGIDTYASPFNGQSYGAYADPASNATSLNYAPQYALVNPQNYVRATGQFAPGFGPGTAGTNAAIAGWNGSGVTDTNGFITNSSLPDAPTLNKDNNGESFSAADMALMPKSQQSQLGLIDNANTLYTKFLNNPNSAPDFNNFITSPMATTNKVTVGSPDYAVDFGVSMGDAAQKGTLPQADYQKNITALGQMFPNNTEVSGIMKGINNQVTSTGAPALTPQNQGLIMDTSKWGNGQQNNGFDAQGNPISLAALLQFDPTAADQQNSIMNWANRMQVSGTPAQAYMQDQVAQYFGLQGAARGVDVWKGLDNTFGAGNPISVGYSPPGVAINDTNGAFGFKDPATIGWGQAFGNFAHEMQEALGGFTDANDQSSPLKANSDPALLTGNWNSTMNDYWGPNPGGADPSAWKGPAKMPGYNNGQLMPNSNTNLATFTVDGQPLKSQTGANEYPQTAFDPNNPLTPGTAINAGLQPQFPNYTNVAVTPNQQNYGIGQTALGKPGGWGGPAIGNPPAPTNVAPGVTPNGGNPVVGKPSGGGTTGGGTTVINGGKTVAPVNSRTTKTPVRPVQTTPGQWGPKPHGIGRYFATGGGVTSTSTSKSGTAQSVTPDPNLNNTGPGGAGVDMQVNPTPATTPLPPMMSSPDYGPNGGFLPPVPQTTPGGTGTGGVNIPTFAQWQAWENSINNGNGNAIASPAWQFAGDLVNKTLTPNSSGSTTGSGVGDFASMFNSPSLTGAVNFGTGNVMPSTGIWGGTGGTAEDKAESYLQSNWNSLWSGMPGFQAPGSGSGAHGVPGFNSFNDWQAAENKGNLSTANQAWIDAGKAFNNQFGDVTMPSTGIWGAANDANEDKAESWLQSNWMGSDVGDNDNDGDNDHDGKGSIGTLGGSPPAPGGNNSVSSFWSNYPNVANMPPLHVPNLDAGGMLNGMMGMQVPGSASVGGDSERNDTVHAMLSPGEIVIPRSIAQGPNASLESARFVAATLARRSPGAALKAAKGR